MVNPVALSGCVYFNATSPKLLCRDSCDGLDHKNNCMQTRRYARARVTNDFAKRKKGSARENQMRPRFREDWCDTLCLESLVSRATRASRIRNPRWESSRRSWRAHAGSSSPFCLTSCIKDASKDPGAAQISRHVLYLWRGFSSRTMRNNRCLRLVCESLVLSGYATLCARVNPTESWY